VSIARFACLLAIVALAAGASLARGAHSATGPTVNCSPGLKCSDGGWDYCGPAHNGAVRVIDGQWHQCFFAHSGYGGYHSDRYGWVDGCGWLYTSCWNYQRWV
jgi:hypothetical protein